jgi:hypothetical protein
MDLDLERILVRTGFRVNQITLRFGMFEAPVGKVSREGYGRADAFLEMARDA